MPNAPVVSTSFRCAIVTTSVLIALSSAVGMADCPLDPPPPTCDVDGQFIGGRWDLSQLSGTYTLSGDEGLFPYIEDPELWDDYHTDGTLTVEMLGGPAENYIDVACDGTVTGVGHERVSGTITKIANISYYDPKYCDGPAYDMNWTVTFERTYSISGNVTGVGQLDLDYDVHTATVDLSGFFAFSFDCVFVGNNASFTGFDISGDVEQVRLSGGYDPVNFSFQPTVSARGPRTWLDDIAHRLALNAYEDITVTLSPSLDPPGSTQPLPQLHSQYFVQDAVTVVDSVQAIAEPSTPMITSFVLQEPSRYLLDVDVDTVAITNVDWRGKPPGQVEFTYGGITETVAGGDVVHWTFNAGETGMTIQAVAKNGAQESLPYIINTPKVAVPGWAGTASDWGGLSGVRYDATLDWPISLETTRTLSTISLFSGLWGISGSASSQFNATAYSSGGPGAGDMTTDASLNLAGKESNFHMEGPNQTTLSCDELTTTGSATAQIPPARWQKTINPLTLVPGLQSAACGLNGLLCSAINSVGIKAAADATLSGTGTYNGQGAQIVWDGGSLGGGINGRISAGATLPPPLASVAGVSVYGGASGCIEFQVAPGFDLTTLGGQLDAGADAYFFGLRASANEQWPFGDACAESPTDAPRGSGGWVPADGQLAMAVADVGGDIIGIAVWSELPAGQTRPSGDIHYRLFQGGAWGAIHALTTDVDSDVAPAVEFDQNGNAVIVYQRSVAPLPSDVADLPAFADGYELGWALIESSTALPITDGVLTTNPVNDFGPRLRRDAAGGIHLFWQRANGIEISGTDADPVSIHVSSWHATTSTWSAESMIASGLENTYGWSAAAFSEDEMLVGLIIDTNGDFATADDRELFQITRTTGSWMLPMQVTSDLVTDDSPQAAFDAAGSPALLWRSGNEVLELRGDLLAAPTVAFTTADPLLDDGVGLEFAHGVVSTAPNGLIAIWPEAVTLQLTHDLDSDWITPLTPFSGNDAQTVHALRAEGTDQLVGYSTQAFEAGNSSLSPLLEPLFARLQVQGLFIDGFESGDMSAWSATTP